MKVCIEIKNRQLMAAFGILMSSIVEKDEEEQSLTEAVERLKASTEPIELDLEEIVDSKDNATFGIAIASCAIAKELKGGRK